MLYVISQDIDILWRLLYRFLNYFNPNADSILIQMLSKKTIFFVFQIKANSTTQLTQGVNTWKASLRPCILSLSRSLLSIRLTFLSRELSEGFFRRPGVALQFGTVEVGRDSSPDCRDFIVLQLLFLLLEVIWKRSPTESSVPVKTCNNECKLSISILPFLFLAIFSVQKKFLESFSYFFFFLRTN